jgi:hypothetical protein
MPKTASLLGYFVNEFLWMSAGVLEGKESMRGYALLNACWSAHLPELRERGTETTYAYHIDDLEAFMLANLGDEPTKWSAFRKANEDIQDSVDAQLPFCDEVESFAVLGSINDFLDANPGFFLDTDDHAAFLSALRQVHEEYLTTVGVFGVELDYSNTSAGYLFR